MDLLRDFNIAVPMYKVATDPEGAREIAEEFGMHCMHILWQLGVLAGKVMIQSWTIISVLLRPF